MGSLQQCHSHSRVVHGLQGLWCSPQLRAQLWRGTTKSQTHIRQHVGCQQQRPLRFNSHPALAWICWVGRSITTWESGHSQIPWHDLDEAGPGQGAEPTWLSMLLLPQEGNAPHNVGVSTVCPPSTAPSKGKQTLDVLGRESQMCPVSSRSSSPQSSAGAFTESRDH